MFARSFISLGGSIGAIRTSKAYRNIGSVWQWVTAFVSITSSVGNRTPIPIGNTPVIPLNSLRKFKLNFYAKLEWMPQGISDPLSSIKDRAAYFMIKQAEDKGELIPEQKIILEPTSGNTGISLARMSRGLGYEVELIIPDKVSQETKETLRRLKAGITETTDDLCPRIGPGTDQSIALASALVASNEKRKAQGLKEYFMPNQYENDANFIAHYSTTGPEIWNQTEGKVTHVFVGVGTGGTIAGIEKFLKEKNPAIKVLAVEPDKGHHIQGLRNFDESAVPGVLSRQINVEVKKSRGEWLRVSDVEAFEGVRQLAAEEKLLVGTSSGAVYAAAAKYVQHDNGGSAVLMFADSGDKYRSLHKLS